MTTTASPPAIGSITPAGNARIGDATHTTSREFNGRIAHASKWDRAFSSSDVERFTSILISPQFAQTDHIWHTEIFNSGNNYDLLNTITTSPVGALYGDHAPATYQSMGAIIVDETGAVAGAGPRVQYVRA